MSTSSGAEAGLVFGVPTDVEVEDVRLTIYQQAAASGRIPRAVDVADILSRPVDQVRAAFQVLASTRHVALDAASEIAMAHPFTAVPLGFSVMGGDTLWWGGCAWDSFALAHLLPDRGPMLVATTCPACGRAHAWQVDNQAPPAGDQVAHFLVPTSHMWDDVVHTCGHQRIFCSTNCVEDWLSATGNQRGYVMDLPTLWRFASDWYTGRLERGYTRREPAAAVDYLQSVGLHGPFWGLPAAPA